MIEDLAQYFSQWLSYQSGSPWLFTRIEFWVFLALVLVVYTFFYQKVRSRNIYLLIISLFFYYKTGGWFTSLLIFSCISNYLLGNRVGLALKKRSKQVWLALGITMNLALLAYFKYAYFFTALLNRMANDEFETYNWLAQVCNRISHTSIDTSEIILPVGISFFTFQAISYLVDVYRKDTRVVHNIFDFSFYLSFFPQLVAGPIVRASGFVPQLYRAVKITREEFGHAVYLILSGLLKKIILADYLAVQFIDRVFDSPASYSGAENLMAVYGYALQIYGDFSGYTDMAIGIALLLGFKLPLNFNAPYKALSMTEFWHRWHISLSSWLRDYLYIPLGGNRKGKFRTYLNLMLTMALGGLWHGANLRFLMWGIFHGFLLAGEKLFLPLRKRIPTTRLARFFSILLTFHLVGAGWILFRAPSTEHVRLMILQIVHVFHWKNFVDMAQHYPLIVAVMFSGLAIHWFPSMWHENFRGWFIRQSIWVKAILVLIVLYILHLFRVADLQPFIYFRF
jgi:D-alanyl-lipoteichoic acid acyltransferase DltB (MBOAT superfamily)